MSKRKTQSIRISSVQRWSAKIAGAALDCTIGELVRRVASGDMEAFEAWVKADELAREKDAEVGI